METEIKLLLDPQARAAVESHPLFAGTAPRQLHETTTYFDTSDFALRGLGATLRIRASEGGFVQTVKLSGGAWRSVTRRGEWQWPVSGDRIDPRPIAAEPEICGTFADLIDRVAPVFATDITRTRRHLLAEGESGIEAVIDEGFLRAGTRRDAICEVELELKGGPPAPLYRLATDLAARASLRFGPEPKAERGYALLDEALPPIHGGKDLELPKTMTIGQGFPRMVDATLADFASELTRAARGDAEGIHRLRAAVRKLRSLLALFGPCVEPVRAGYFNQKLREFGGILGQGRDWDVFLMETLGEAAEAIGGPEVAPLREASAARHAATHDCITQAVAGPAPTEIILGLGAWTAETHWLIGDPAERLSDILPGLLDRLAGRVRKCRKRMRDGDTDDLHALRKAMKKLRYSADDAACLFKPKAAQRYSRRVKAVLTVLGTINDAAVTQSRIEDLVPEAGSALARAASDVLAWNAGRRKQALRDFASSWAKFEAAEVFWR